MGFVYFLRSGPSGPIKIGFTGTTPTVRLAALQTGNPEVLAFLGTLQGTREDEQQLHQRFGHLHVQGEWFRPEADLLAFIDGARFGQRGAPQTWDALFPWEDWFDELARYVHVWLARERVDHLDVRATLAPHDRLSDLEMETLEWCRQTLIMGATTPGRHDRADLRNWVAKAEELLRRGANHADAGSDGGVP